jgi:hypothetical protein
MIQTIPEFNAKHLAIMWQINLAVSGRRGFPDFLLP